MMKPHVLLLVILVSFISASFVSATSFDCEKEEDVSANALDQCLKDDSKNVLDNKKIAEQTIGDFAHAQKVFDALMACGKGFDVYVKNDLVINCLEKLTPKTLQVRLLRKMARWTSIVKSYQLLKQCDDATLDLYPRASSKEVERVLCFQFESHKIQTGLIYYSQENEQLIISGIQF
jgi:hypothetical protein